MTAMTVRPAAQRGFTLLEVLVAIVVFSVGLLGIAGLQVAGMRYTHGSQLRSLATMQAENMADNMRANRVAVADGHYNVTDAMPTTYPKDCGVENCAPEELALFDLATWNSAASEGKPHESNHDVLPAGDGVVCIDSTPNDGDPTDWACDDTGTVYAVKLVWHERTVGDWEEADDGGGEETTPDVQQHFLFLRVVP
jgi:type IV pilus assembly protein PilV